MKNYLGLVICDVKEFMSDKVNLVLIAIIVFMGVGLYGQYRLEKIGNDILAENQKMKTEILNEIKTNRKKMHFRYFNLTRSLEDIYDVEIDTRNGEEKR